GHVVVTQTVIESKAACYFPSILRIEAQRVIAEARVGHLGNRQRVGLAQQEAGIAKPGAYVAPAKIFPRVAGLVLAKTVLAIGACIVQLWEAFRDHLTTHFDGVISFDPGKARVSRRLDVSEILDGETVPEGETATAPGEIANSGEIGELVNK